MRVIQIYKFCKDKKKEAYTILLVMKYVHYAGETEDLIIISDNHWLGILKTTHTSRILNRV